MREEHPYLDAQSRFIVIGGKRVHYKREGSGPVLVLLHGSGSSLQCFDGVLPALQAHFEVVRLDLPGCGASAPMPEQDYRIETFVRFVNEFVERLSLKEFQLVGNSLGGNIAWNFALDYPDKVELLFLLNATGYPEKSLPAAFHLARNAFGRFVLRRMLSRRSTTKNLHSLIGPRTVLDDAVIDRVYALMAIPANREAFISFARTDQRDRSPELRKVKTPTLVLRGEQVDGQYFARDIPGSKEIVLTGVGRLLPEEAPQEIIESILNFQVPYDA
ncbi:alpha/beta hydrolase [Pseudomonas sp. MAFF 301449]|uniref:Alpha/beta hydrolase n=1 Tax=Pseudomonas cyclaminis TaxID=2781239 RepID=A0ABR9SRJ6_9PSED|nr:alpha/beta hydrolase [Pseudomonas cyclaminis]MBE8591552.1 alpha/beta hydrolase [Pseudomonas cyclaminis]MBE8598642.1 alpha/beta hydrolase [Pseudomonas cyclaminis]